jgi:hypothetical protein
VAHACGFRETPTTARMLSLLCVRASGTVGKDGIRYNMTSTLGPVAGECMDPGVPGLCRGWRRCGAIRARNTIAAQTPCVRNHHTLNTHHDMLYSIRPHRNRASCNTRSYLKASTAAQFVACWPGCCAIGRCQPCPYSLTLRSRRAAPPAQDIGDAACSYHEEASLPQL